MARTAKQKAAQLKAARASAAKRRGRGKGRSKRPGRVRRAGSYAKRSYQAGHTGKGAVYRRNRDRYHSKGYFATRTGRKGSKPAGGAQRAYRKVSTVASVAYAPHGVAISALRHRSAKRAGTVNKPRSRKRKR